jgi:hypothetical protein
MDEAIVASDHLVIDDDIRRTLAPVNRKTRFFIIVDSCNSGTVADLRYEYRTATDIWFDKPNPHFEGARVVLLSACLDEELAWEGFLDGQHTGMLTGTLIKLMRSRPQLRNDTVALYAELRRVFAQDPSLSKQTPHLSASTKLRGMPFL